MSIAEHGGSKTSSSAAELMTSSVRTYVAVQSAYEQCAPVIREAVDDMLEIVKSQDATNEEKNRALITIVEALFPSLAVDFLGMCETVRSSAPAIEKRNEMRREEESFAKRVQEIMQSNNMTQESLASLSGVGQSAISNMLSRQSRPQKRTVVKIAKALGVQPRELWSGVENGDLS